MVLPVELLLHLELPTTTSSCRTRWYCRAGSATAIPPASTPCNSNSHCLRHQRSIVLSMTATGCGMLVASSPTSCSPRQVQRTWQGWRLWHWSRSKGRRLEHSACEVSAWRATFCHVFFWPQPYWLIEHIGLDGARAWEECCWRIGGVVNCQ